MKNLLFNALFFLSFLGVSHAQRGDWQWGGFVSEHTFWLFNRSDFYGDHGIRVESSRLDKPDGFAAGLAVSYRFNDWLSIQAEPNFNRQKQVFTICSFSTIDCSVDSVGRVGSNAASHVITLGYVSLPFHVNFHVPTRQRLTFYVKAGAYLSFSTNYKVHYTRKKWYWGINEPTHQRSYYNYVLTNNVFHADGFDNGFYPGQDTVAWNSEYEIDYIYERFVWGASGGLGWSYQLDNDAGEIYLGLRGSYSLSRVENRDAERTGTGIPVWATAPLLYQLVPPEGGDPFTNRPRTHNIRLGLELGALFTIP